MKTLKLQQHSDAWNAHRASHRNASEAPAMMGVSSRLKRSELIRLVATGSEREFSRFTEEVIFERGHEVEALARPIVERKFGIDLFPATGESTEYPEMSASFDGITMDETIVWECKQWNEEKAAAVSTGSIPKEDIWQCVHQLVVSEAQRLIYTVSDGVEERTVSCELTLMPAMKKALLDGWKQFAEDVAAYKPEPAAAEVIGRAPENLPALRIEVAGLVKASNLAEFRERALDVFRGINTNLATDEDFATAEKTVKWCGEVEDKLKDAKARALEQAADVNALFAAIDEITAEARTKRLELDKRVKARKEEVRFEIIQNGMRALAEHVTGLDKRIRTRGARVSMPVLQGNFAGVIKGLKTIASIKDAVATELAHMKIEANALADKIDANVVTLQADGAAFESLFPDTQALVLKDPADLSATIKARIADHHAEQRRREEAALRTAPLPAAVLPAPSTTPPTPITAAKPRMRADGPTAGQIVSLVAKTYGVTEQAAAAWLRKFDFTPFCAATERERA